MAYTVEFSERALRDIDEIVAYIHTDSPVAATRWRQRLEEKSATLRQMPRVCGLAPESDVARFEVRQLLYGRYRVLFTIREQTVFILTIRHGARRFIAGDDIDAIE